MSTYDYEDSGCEMTWNETSFLVEELTIKLSLGLIILRKQSENGP